ncbi:ATP-dependent DNA helicase [Extibacter muris]|uniref:ATP-dependent DNA helicase n=1 Tax=Extibacter muris TaxID=1796622 RepID=UPI001D063D87|nr:ATP-dependent DNA helicase [Extibacter muris]MCB6202748.1 ATP-dependent DNA helicase [Extibacter muris]MCQ4664456.1 ATP-dependent DNA helicase [Extibacter muris]MCQ4693665.1 ATP-dependent DNA helicase [Extibacter muris]
MEQPLIRISVRRLVEFILQSGDIDNRTAGADKDAMLLGGKIHRKIQRQMGADYHAEVALKHVIGCRGFDLQIEGRADGIIDTPEGTVVDEIKGVFKELHLLAEPVEVHLAQAKCYAFMYAEQNGLDRIGVQMTYCNMETEEIKRFQSVYGAEELRDWFFEVAGKYEKWARYEITWKEKRNASIKGVEFPFAYRDGQKDLVSSVYRTILRKKKLFIQAPTGVGKTMASVFPAVKAVGEGLGEKIFYLTAKTITRTVAQQAFETLKEQALRFKVITLTAKEKICFCEEANCNPDYCPYAKGHYDRVNDAVYELITTSDDMSREVIEEQARRWNVCPFEMGLDVSLWVDGVICDYNYVFDPNAHLKRFFGDGMSGEYLFLIDEAHNLVERGREMYSAALYKEDFLEIRRLVKQEDSKLAGRLDECNKQMLALKRECETYQVLDSVSHIYLKLMNLMAELERYLEECTEEEKRKKVLDLYFDVRMFLGIYDRLDENYLIYSELEDSGRFKVRLFCVNPAANLKEFLEKGNSAIFFSATLLPIHYYKELLSTEKDDYAIYALSPFEEERRLLLLGTDVSTKYTRRSEDMYRRYAEYLKQVAETKKGNYIAFFPSYQFMEQVYAQFLSLTEDCEDIEYVMQSQYMSEEAREIFLENFEEEREKSLMGFCVMGGIFSEGIDLVEDKLIGAAIIGTGLPQVCRERELLKTYFDGKGYRGFDYAYLYPGMNKVLQSAGRVIRTDEDRGVILLLDERFGDVRYREIFPREWKTAWYCSLRNVKEQMHRFWEPEE